MSLFVFLFYLFTCSVILTYGIGLERVHIISSSDNACLIFFIKTAVAVISPLSVLWFLSRFVLLPMRASFLIPIAFITVCAFFNIGVEYVFFKMKIDFKPAAPNEFGFTYGLVLFALYEAAGFFEALIIVTAAFLSMAVLSFILKAVKKTIKNGNAGYDWKLLPLSFVSMGFIVLALYSVDSSWLFSLFL